MRNKQFKELAICGMEAVKSLERNNPGKIKRFYFNSQRAPLFGGLCKRLAAAKIPYNCVKSDLELQKLCGTVHHQGVVAMIEEPQIENICGEDIRRAVKNKTPLIYLDGVQNANNIGAIVRSAAFFGFWTLILNDSVADECITTSTYRIAEGAMELMQIFCVQNIERLLKDLQDDFCIVGFDLQAEKSVRDISKLCGEKPPFLIFGNEEVGISPSVRRLCTQLVKMHGAFKKDAGGKVAVQSLNVAQAASIAFYEAAQIR